MKNWYKKYKAKTNNSNKYKKNKVRKHVFDFTNDNRKDYITGQHPRKDIVNNLD